VNGFRLIIAKSEVKKEIGGTGWMSGDENICRFGKVQHDIPGN
jgi:hypothetical protein